jgi:hypothetical protein
MAAERGRGVLSDAEFHELVVKMARQLNGLTLAQAEHVLRTVSRLVAVTNVVDSPSPKFERVA